MHKTDQHASGHARPSLVEQYRCNLRGCENLNSTIVLPQGCTDVLAGLGFATAAPHHCNRDERSSRRAQLRQLFVRLLPSHHGELENGRDLGLRV